MTKYRIGETIGIWTVLGYNYNYGKKLRYIAKCNRCGHVNDHMVKSDLKRIPKRCNHTRNVWSSRRLAVCYNDMMKRCHNHNHPYYKWYGARGIEVCKEWRENKLAFNDWAIANGYTEELTIDRIDNNKGYSPDNCRWVTRYFNSTHKRCNRHLTYGNISMTSYEWDRKLGFRAGYIYHKCEIWPVEKVERYIADIIEGRVKYKKIKHKSRDMTIKGETHTLKEWATIIGWTQEKLSNHYTRVGKKKCHDTIKRLLKQQKDSLVIRVGNN